MQILLASSSPRRQALLRQVGLPCRIVTPEVDEETLQANASRGGAPSTLDEAVAVACHLAEAKADDVIARLAGREAAGEGPHPKEIVLAADTIVVCDGALLGKPADAADARRMLRALSGRTHHVVTAICLRPRLARADDVAVGGVWAETTEVTFHPLSDALIEAYVSSGEPLDKAGGYGIQGLGAALVRRVNGCYFNVVGLPLGLLSDRMETLGAPIHEFWAHRS